LLAVIGGSGLYGLSDLEVEDSDAADTPYGQTSGRLVRGRLEGSPVLFIARHGEDHAVAPHLVNYRANIEALRQAGATRVLAVCTVGSIAPDLLPGTIVIPDQIVDYTWGRAQTFHEPGDPVPHVDFTHPYSAEWRLEVTRATGSTGISCADGATYAAVQGPRFETAAEIRRFRNDGCHVIGMTGMPEAALAREAGLDYAVICPVANLAAGLSPVELTPEEVFAVASGMLEQINAIIAKLAGSGAGA
jgi:5'-deoxy-5'-methylthioadenosine phosphorylase